MTSYKITIIGDSSVGKTSIIKKYLEKSETPKEDLPTVFANYQHTIEVDGIKCELNIQDTAGAEGYDNIRRFSFYDVSILNIIFISIFILHWFTFKITGRLLHSMLCSMFKTIV